MTEYVQKDRTRAGTQEAEVTTVATLSGVCTSAMAKASDPLVVIAFFESAARQLPTTQLAEGTLRFLREIHHRDAQLAQSIVSGVTQDMETGEVPLPALWRDVIADLRP